MLIIFVFTLTACTIPGLNGDSTNDDNNDDNTVCEHTELSAWQTVKAPTCTEDGEQERHCLSEGCEYKEKGKINKLGHDEVNHPQVDATCTETGLTAYKTCSRCDYATEPTVIEKVAHTPGAWKTTTAPTCYADGVKQKACTVCEAVLESATVTTTVKHTLGDWEEVTAPTCTDVGEKKKSCTNDGCTYFVTEEIAASGHDMDDGVVTTPATCTEDGVMTYTCENECGHTETEVIYAIGHEMDEGVVTTPATCLTDGVMTYTCENGCGHTETEAIDALNHDLKDAVGKEANCTEAGYTAYKACSRCDYVEGKTVINAKDHDMGEWVNVDSTHQKRECQREGCDYSQTQTVGCMHLEMSEWAETKAATCTESGEQERHCLAEGCEWSETKTIAPIPHDLKDISAKAATCTEDGYTAHKKCSRCDYTEGYSLIPALTHSLKDIAEKPATCTEDGYTAHKKCARCGYTEGYEVKEALKHDLKDISAKAATCTEDGYTAHKKCARCGYTEGFEVSPKLGHKKGEGVVTKAPNCTEGGTKIYYCENPGCGEEIDIEVLPYEGHNMQLVPGKDSTCTEHGYTVHSACTKCDYVEGKIELELADHEMGEWVKIDEDTIRRDCENCDHYETKPAPMDGENIDKDGWTKPTT